MLLIFFYIYIYIYIYSNFSSTMDEHILSINYTIIFKNKMTIKPVKL